MTVIDPRVCCDCEESKPLSEFRKAPTRFGGDGYSKVCKECIRKKRAATKAAGEPAKEEEITGPRLDVPATQTLGIRAHHKGSDIVVDQDQEGGAVRIWLTVQEIDALHAFAHQPVPAAEPEASA